MTAAQDKLLNNILQTIRACSSYQFNAEVVSVHGDNAAEVKFSHEGSKAVEVILGPRGAIYDGNGRQDFRSFVNSLYRRLAPHFN